MTTENDEHKTDREKLRILKGIFEDAVENNSIEDMRPFVHPDFSFVSFTDRSFSDFDAFKKQWEITRKNMVGTGNFSTSLNPEPTLFIDNIAVSYGNADNKLVDKKGNHFEFQNHWTVIFRRVDDEWKVLRAHNSLNPFSNPMLASGVKNKVIKYSLLSFLGGAILCSMLVFLILK